MVEHKVIPIGDSSFEEVSTPHNAPIRSVSDRGSNNELSSFFERAMSPPTLAAGVS